MTDAHTAREPLRGCICHIRNPKWHKRLNGVAHDIAPDCPYHQAAAQRPDDHSIPWNCPTFYDGCNCGTVR